MVTGKTKRLYIGIGSLFVAVSAFFLFAIGSTSNAVSSYRNCADDTIIRCGAITEAELLQKYDSNVQGVQGIFSHYGISRGDLAGTSSQIKHGTVYQDGRVVVDGKTVATNAYSVSRVRFSEQSTPVTINGTTFYQGPNMSIFVQAVDAYVYMRNGVFYRAVLSSCGNPVMATPVAPPKPTPVYACESLKATKIDRTRFSFATTASAKDGAEVVNYTYNFGDGQSQTGGATIEHNYAQPGTYTVTVTVNVRVDGVVKPVTSANCKVTVKVDSVPVTPSYVCESLKVDKIDRTKFKFTSTASAQNGAEIVNYTYNFGDGKTQTGGATIEHTYAQPGTYTATVTVNVKVGGEVKPVTGANCKVTVTVAPVEVKPTYVCESLKAEKISRTTFKFISTASAKDGAEIINYTYNFGDGKTQTGGASIEHTYAQAGTYTTTVTVNVKVGGEVKPVTGANCKVTVEVKPVPVTPTYVCEMLKLEKISRTTFRFITTASAEGGAEIVNYTYNFGDGQSQTGGATIEHTYAKPGTYTAKVSVNVKVNGEAKVATAQSCQVKVTVDKVPAQPVDVTPTQPTPTQPTPVQPAPAQGNVVPTELPLTGVEGLIGGGVGLTSLTTAGYYWAASRKSLKDAWMKR